MAWKGVGLDAGQDGIDQRARQGPRPRHTAGRPVRRRRVPALLAVPLATGAAMAAPAPARARAQLTRGPYLQDASDTRMTLLWRSDAPVPAMVEYRPAGAPAAPWSMVGIAGASRAPAITLTGLQPGTAYEYRIRGEVAEGAWLYEGGAFRTLSPPDADTLRFVHIADNQTGHVPHGDLVRRLLREDSPPELLIHSGDLCENGLRAEEWERWFQTERELLARVPIFPALGNHEFNSPLYFENFRLPSNGTGQGAGRWYSFDAGPAHFVALDVVYSDVAPGSPQHRWLDADLARTDRPWKFVYFHYPCYNASPHHGSNLRIRASLERLFLDRRVSAVFSGHGHLYERAHGAAARPGAPPLLWFVSGGGGGVPQPAGREAWTQYTEVTHHFLRVTIRSDRLSTVGVRPDGSEFDRFEGQLDADGRVQALAALGPPVVVTDPSVAEFLRSPRGGLLLGYQALATLVAPLGASLGVRSRRARVIPIPSGEVHVPAARPLDPYAGWRGLPVLAVAGLVVAAVLLALLPAAPLQWLVGFDFYSATLTLHGLAAVAILGVAGVAGQMGYRLAVRRAPSLPWLAACSWATAGLAGLTAVLGNLLYASYVASGGPMEELLKKAPEAHAYLFEFKARAGLVPLPLAVAAAFVVRRYGDDLRRDRPLAEIVALALLLEVSEAHLPVVVGAAITRLRGLL